MLSTILQRFREPSSWAALAGPFAAAGFSLSPEWWQVVSMALAAGAAAAGIVLRERGL